MKDSKKNKKIIILCSLPFILLFSMYLYIYLFGDEQDSIYGYSRYEKYNYNFQTYYFINYDKYYYYMGVDEEKILKDYSKVSENNIETIKSFYNDFRNIMDKQEKSYIIDLDENDIDYDDYCVIYDYCDANKMDSCKKYREFSLQLYDTQTNILYVLKIYQHFYR